MFFHCIIASLTVMGVVGLDVTALAIVQSTLVYTLAIIEPIFHTCTETDVHGFDFGLGVFVCNLGCRYTTWEVSLSFHLIRVTYSRKT